MKAILREVAHRPWPLLAGPWVMAQSWHDLSFAHWAVDCEKLRAVIPDPLEIDSFDGQAWLAVVPFRMSGVRLRGAPAVPWLSAFPELNVRTYVKYRGNPACGSLVLTRVTRWPLPSRGRGSTCPIFARGCLATGAMGTFTIEVAGRTGERRAQSLHAGIVLRTKWFTG